MNHVEHTLFISESIDLVWAYATELPRLTDWFPRAESVEGHINPGDEVGLRYSLHFGRLVRLNIETVEIHPLRTHRRAFRYPAWLLHGDVTMRFDPADGGTLVTFMVDYDFDVPLMAKALGAMQDARIQRIVLRSATNFKNYVEAKHFARRRAAIRDTTLAPSVNMLA
ncbi:MAG: SRPBCC family protein [Chloroflexota bacterium]|nr:SRPBCC family protein [Chloroflexota bacterium]